MYKIPICFLIFKIVNYLFYKVFRGSNFIFLRGCSNKSFLAVRHYRKIKIFDLGSVKCTLRSVNITQDFQFLGMMRVTVDVLNV